MPLGQVLTSKTKTSPLNREIRIHPGMALLDAKMPPAQEEYFTMPETLELMCWFITRHRCQTALKGVAFNFFRILFDDLRIL
jgi:hypothetical protein